MQKSFLIKSSYGERCNKYNNDGRRASETLADGALLTFGYDNAGQLTSEGRSGGSVSGYTIAYTYDNAGNRSTKTLNNVTENYSYDAANKLTSAGGKTYTYDSAGNVKTVASTAGTTTLSWDADSRLTGIAYPNSTTNNFTYNGLAQRVGTTDSRGTLTYTLADDSVDSPVLKDGAATYTHGLGLVSEVRGGTSKFYHADALGTTRAMTGSTGSVTDTRSTDAFGNTFTAGSSGTTPTPFGFAGQHGYQSDPDSGLMRLGHRYYDASVGRFLSRDPIQDGDNWYAYCDNDPVNAVDPTGLRPPSQEQLGNDERDYSRETYDHTHTPGITDVNFTFGFGLGITFGWFIQDDSEHFYLGGGLTTPGGGFAVTGSPYDASPGTWSGGFAGFFGPGGGFGNDSKGNFYWEGGFGTPGASLTAYYTF